MMDKKAILTAILNCLKGDFSGMEGMELDDESILTFHPKTGTIKWWPWVSNGSAVKGKAVEMVLTLTEK